MSIDVRTPALVERPLPRINTGDLFQADLDEYKQARERYYPKHRGEPQRVGKAVLQLLKQPTAGRHSHS